MKPDEVDNDDEVEDDIRRPQRKTFLDIYEIHVKYKCQIKVQALMIDYFGDQ